MAPRLEASDTEPVTLLWEEDQTPDVEPLKQMSLMFSSVLSLGTGMKFIKVRSFLDATASQGLTQNSL